MIIDCASPPLEEQVNQEDKTLSFFFFQTEVFGLNESARRRHILDDTLQGLKSQVREVLSVFTQKPCSRFRELPEISDNTDRVSSPWAKTERNGFFRLKQTAEGG